MDEGCFLRGYLGRRINKSIEKIEDPALLTYYIINNIEGKRQIALGICEKGLSPNVDNLWTGKLLPYIRDNRERIGQWNLH